MAQDIAPDLLEAIRRDFVRNLGGSKRAAELLEAIQSGRAGYAEAGEYAEEVGRALSEAFQSNLSGDTLPDGRMYWNLADRVIRPLLEEDHALVSEAARQVQQQLNEAAGIGIKAQSVPLDQDRVDGILNRLAAAEQYEAVAWLLGEPVILFSRSVVDESVHRNAEFQGEAGLTPRIIRRAESHCCEWCARLAGTYTYPDVPRDVYRRHDFCRCVVEYDPGDGKRQTVHSGHEGKRRYVQDGYGGYEESREARIQRAQEMAATADERAKAAREKRITTWAKKEQSEWTAASSESIIKPKTNPEVCRAIQNGTVSKKVNRQKQERHLRGTAGYIPGRSYIYGGLSKAQELVDTLSGTGSSVMQNGVWQHKERVQADTIIGVYVDPITGKETPTNCAIIIYSKTGSHIFPRKG